MKLQQLRYVWEVAHHELNVSATAQSLYTSQPGISKQIRLLEDELGVEIFTRSGKHLIDVTPAGEAIIRLSGEILDQVANIKRLAQEYTCSDEGEFRLAATYTHSRYTLPTLVAQFKKAYPKVVLNLFEGTSEQVEQRLLQGQADIGIQDGGILPGSGLVRLQCYSWQRVLILPHDHPLASAGNISLNMLAEHPLIVFTSDNSRGSVLLETFKKQKLEPNIAFSASDSEVIVSYVNLGLGLGLVHDREFSGNPLNSDLVKIAIGHLIPPCTTTISATKSLFFAAYMLDFISLFAPHLDRNRVNALLGASSNRGQKMAVD